MTDEPKSGTVNHLKLGLEKRQFFCTAELVLGRDHNMGGGDLRQRGRGPAERDQGHQRHRPAERQPGAAPGSFRGHSSRNAA